MENQNKEDKPYLTLRMLMQCKLEDIHLFDVDEEHDFATIVELNDKTLTEAGKEAWKDVLDAKVERIYEGSEGLQIELSGSSPERICDFSYLLAGQCSASLYEKWITDAENENSEAVYKPIDDRTFDTLCACHLLWLRELYKDKPVFNGYSFKDKDFIKKDFSYAIMENTEFISEKLENTKFDFAHLHKAVFVNCEFKDVKFAYADLSNTTFRNCIFGFSNFISCDLSESKFIDCYIFNSGTSDCIIKDMEFQNTDKAIFENDSNKQIQPEMEMGM